jgi:hypothetical protein
MPTPRGSPGWAAAAGPPTCAPLASAGGTARKESVISQGGTPVFGLVLPASDLSAPGVPVPGFPAPDLSAPGMPVPGFPAPDLSAPGMPVPGFPAPGFPVPGLAAEGIVAPVGGGPPFAGPGPSADLSPREKAGAGGLSPDGLTPIVPVSQAAAPAAAGSIGGLTARGKGPRWGWPTSGRLGAEAGLGAGGNGGWLAPAPGQSGPADAAPVASEPVRPPPVRPGPAMPPPAGPCSARPPLAGFVPRSAAATASAWRAVELPRRLGRARLGLLAGETPGWLTAAGLTPDGLTPDGLTPDGLTPDGAAPAGGPLPAGEAPVPKGAVPGSDWAARKGSTAAPVFHA